MGELCPGSRLDVQETDLEDGASHRPPGFADRELAAEAGRKGQRTLAAQRRAKREDPLYEVKRQLPNLMDDLLKAARGQGEWKDLPLTMRLTALQRCIEYGVGKTISLDKMAPKDVISEGGGSEETGTIEFS